MTGKAQMHQSLQQLIIPTLKGHETLNDDPERAHELAKPRACAAVAENHQGWFGSATRCVDQACLASDSSHWLSNWV